MGFLPNAVARPMIGLNIASINPNIANGNPIIAPIPVNDKTVPTPISNIPNNTDMYVP